MSPSPESESASVESKVDVNETGNRRYPCTVSGCHKAYRRNEHLLRHLRSHNLRKPYHCPRCGKYYGRQDVLKRHMTQQHEILNPEREKIHRHAQNTKGFPDITQNGHLAQTSSEWNPDTHHPTEPLLDKSKTRAEASFALDVANARALTTPGSLRQYGFLTIIDEESATANTETPDGFSVDLAWANSSPAILNVEPNLQCLGSNALSKGIFEALDDLQNAEFWPYTSSNRPGHQSPPFNGSKTGAGPQLCLRIGSPAFRQCLDLYFENFHPLWPILHRATFDPTAENQDLVNSVLMIGAWESGISSWMDMALRWNESLAKRLCSDLSEFPSIHQPDSQSTLQAYQALLLNVVFTLQCSDDTKFSKAYLRYCMMLAIFRDTSIFEEQHGISQDTCKEDAIPGSWLRREKRKRLAFYSLWISIYFCFLRGYNPMLRYDELCLTTPCSERLWEAKTTKEWHQVKVIESQRRTKVRFMALVDIAMDCEGRDSLPALLEDEYGYGLCAMQAWLWPDINKSRSQKENYRVLDATRIYTPPSSSRVVEFWTTQLGIWKDCYRDRALGALLSSQKHRSVVETSAISLYHLSHMALRANLKAIAELASGLQHAHVPSPFRRQLESRILEWAATPDARLAIWHAAQIVKLLKNISGHSGNDETHAIASHVSFIAPIALYEAGLVVWAYTRSVQVCDACAIGSTLQAIAIGLDPFDLFEPQKGNTFMQWLKGGGREQIEGVVVCACKLGNVVGIYEEWLAKYATQWRSVAAMSTSLHILKHKN